MKAIFIMEGKNDLRFLRRPLGKAGYVEGNNLKVFTVYGKKNFRQHEETTMLRNFLSLDSRYSILAKIETGRDGVKSLIKVVLEQISYSYPQVSFTAMVDYDGNNPNEVKEEIADDITSARPELTVSFKSIPLLPSIIEKSKFIIYNKADNRAIFVFCLVSFLESLEDASKERFPGPGSNSTKVKKLSDSFCLENFINCD